MIPADLLDDVFLSTLSLRRATTAPVTGGEATEYFYPRSPCGERPAAAVNNLSVCVISIHALLAESDGDENDKFSRAYISIHALLAESDTGNASGIHTHWISIHALLAESDKAQDEYKDTVTEFLSTLSLRRATL